ncbi:MAG: hypothetical protein Q8R67_12110, partial [Rhodoferax sp.]|nr:hypothetical protein [Rhodoferax sp.]
MANEIKFVLSADGSGLKVVVDGAAKSLDSLAQSGSKSAEKLSAGFTSSFADIGKASIVFSAVSAAASAVVNVMAQLPTSGIQFAASLETTRIGMAGILASMTAVDGKATSFAQGLAIASDMTAKLQRDAMLTAASTQELVTAFQAMVGPGLAAGMSLDQIRQLATTGVNAVKSLGMESSQVVQELRDLVQGGITPASSTLATALGLKDADIAKAKASTEGLFTFLMERMKGFTAGAEAYSTTFTGTMQQMAEQLQKSAAMAFAPLGEELKVQAKGITEALSDDANVAQFQKLTGAAQMIAQALGQTTQAAIRHSDAIVTVVQVYGTVKFGTMIAGWTASAQALMAASQASRLSAAQSAVEGVANTEVTLTARQKIAAYMAELAAKEAAAAATVAQTTAQLASLQAGIAGLELSRSEVVAKMASTRSTIAQAQAQLAAAQAAGAQSFALAMVTEATNTLTGAQVRQSALMTELALLGRQQATVSASIAVAAAAQGAATEGAALATNHLNVAQKAATVGGGAMGAVLGALGGPVGIAIAAVTLLTMKLFEMNSEATKAAVISVSKDRVDAATAQGTKAGDEELSNLTGKISELKRTKLELLAEQKSPGVMAWVFGDDYKSGLDSQLQHVEAQITGLEATTSAASAIAQSNGTQVKLQGTMALQQIDQLLDKYKTASQLSDNAKKEKAALDTQLAALKSSNASTADITAKETEVAQAKRFIEVKLQADLKAEREKGLADLQAVANASYAVEKAQAQQKVALQAQAIDTLEMQNELSFKSLLKTDANYFQAESAYYAERLALQLKSLDAQTAAVQKEMELQAKRLDVRNLRPTDRIAAEEKLIELGTKAIDLQTKRNALEGGETLRIAEKMAGFRQAQVDSDQKAFEALHGQVTALRESNAVMELHNQEIGLNQRALDALTLSRLDAGIALQQSIVDEDAYKVSLGQGTAEMQEQINKLAELNRQRGLVAIGQTKTAGAEAAKVVFEQWKHGWEETDRLARDVFTTWAEDGSNAAKKIGDTLEKALLSAIYEATLKPIAFQIYSSVAGAPSGSTASGNPLGSIAGSANGGLGGYLGSVEIAGSSLSAIGSSITTGFSAGWAGMDTAAAVEAYSAAGMTGTATGLGAGSAAGSALAAIGPVGWAILAAAAIGSQLTGGHEYTTGTGISGKFSGSGFAGSNYQTWQNDGDKLFGMSVGHSSSGTNHSALDDATSAQWAKGYAALQASAITSAQALGLSADAITSFSKDVSVALGSDAAANAKAIEAMFVGLADSMATAVAPKITELAKDGEAASVTLARLSASITTANAWLSMLRNRLFDVSMAGADAASALVDAFGGLDKFTASSRAFYEAYYSDGEKVANSQAQMTQALAQLGIALPINKDALKALAATLDMNTESGRAAYATLLQIAPEFASTADLIARAAKDAADGLLSA